MSVQHSGGYWGLVVQRGPWSDTAQDKYNAKSDRGSSTPSFKNAYTAINPGRVPQHFPAPSVAKPVEGASTLVGAQNWLDAETKGARGRVVKGSRNLPHKPFKENEAIEQEILRKEQEHGEALRLRDLAYENDRVRLSQRSFKEKGEFMERQRQEQEARESGANDISLPQAPSLPASPRGSVYDVDMRTIGRESREEPVTRSVPSARMDHSSPKAPAAGKHIMQHHYDSDAMSVASGPDNIVHLENSHPSKAVTERAEYFKNMKAANPPKPRMDTKYGNVKRQY